MERFPQYNLNHFYSLSFLEGGLTLDQAHILFKHSMEREADKEYNRMKFIANLIGADTGDEKKSKNNLEEAEKQQELPVFRDPNEYDNMSEEERKKLTEQMMSKHKKWVNNENLGNKKPKSKI